MKIAFDNGYIEVRKSFEPDKVFVIISSRDGGDAHKKITNTAEITVAQLKELTSDIT